MIKKNNNIFFYYFENTKIYNMSVILICIIFISSNKRIVRSQPYHILYYHHNGTDEYKLYWVALQSTLSHNYISVHYSHDYTQFDSHYVIIHKHECLQRKQRKCVQIILLFSVWCCYTGGSVDFNFFFSDRISLKYIIIYVLQLLFLNLFSIFSIFKNLKEKNKICFRSQKCDSF